MLRSSMLRVATLIALVSAASGCEDTVAPELPEIATVEVTVGAQTVTLTPPAAGGSITISGASSDVSVKAFDEAGTEIVLAPADFELRLTPTNVALLTYVHLTGTSGRINRTASGTTSVAVVLFNVSRNETAFGPVNFNVTVQ